MKKYPIPEEEYSYFSGIDERSDFEHIQVVREGIPYYAFENLAEKSSFTISDWSVFLGLSSRSLQRYKKEKRTFGRLHSDRIIEIMLVLRKGEEIFKDKRDFSSWMSSKNIALGGIKPRELLDSSFGIRILNDELTRISYGILA
jgi:putative toxin-antitoxin system antitoxin component (TIGR02293 family)